MISFSHSTSSAPRSGALALTWWATVSAVPSSDISSPRAVSASLNTSTWLAVSSSSSSSEVWSTQRYMDTS